METNEFDSIISKYKRSVNDAILMQKLNKLLDESAEKLNISPSNITQNLNSSCENSSTKEEYTEEKYEYITEYGTQILALFTPAGECTYLSRNFERLTEQSAINQLGDNFFTLLHPDFQEKLRAALRPSPAFAVADIKKQILRLKMQNGDGKYYWYQFTIHTQTKQTRTWQYACLIENIHENMQIQNTLQKARLEAELALRARSEFLANMSHELRTPLNAVIGFSQIMEKGVFGKIDNPQYVGYVRHIQESGHDLLAKIEDLLEIANIDAGRVSLEREEIFINDLIKHVIKTQSHHSQVAKVSLSYVPKGNILLFVDRMKLQHILGHLVANAIKFNRAGGEVTIEVNREGKSGINIAIHDNGIGINDLKCHDIRESLQQDNCWTAKNSHNIGIGLALAKEFIALHNGTIKITSSAGIGTTISITLPRECICLSSTKETTENKFNPVKQLENG
ncbi:MAG: HAMP domain-containing sensor histidine kinase [Rickettsiales bacterium]